MTVRDALELAVVLAVLNVLLAMLILKGWF